MSVATADNKLFVIKEEKLKSLLKDSIKLSALENGGVDNWTQYGDSISDAINSFNEYNKTNFETIEEIAENELKDFAYISFNSELYDILN